MGFVARAMKVFEAAATPVHTCFFSIVVVLQAQGSYSVQSHLQL